MFRDLHARCYHTVPFKTRALQLDCHSVSGEPWQNLPAVGGVEGLYICWRGSPAFATGLSPGCIAAPVRLSRQQVLLCGLLNSRSPSHRQGHFALLDANESQIPHDNPRNDLLARAVEDITPDIKSECVNGRNVCRFVVAGGKAPSDCSKTEYAGLLLDRADDNGDSETTYKTIVLTRQSLVRIYSV